MSFHVNTSMYKCNACPAYFVAFEHRMSCPNCNKPEQSNGENYDFIDKLARSLAINKNKHGSFIPPAWFFGCDMDRVQALFFRFFDERERGEPSELLLRLQGKGPLFSYEEKHTKDILDRVTVDYEDKYLERKNKLHRILIILKKYLKL